MNNRPVSPINGQPLPDGHRWETSEEAREAGKKGGKASGKSRAAKRDLRQALEMLLEKDFTDKNGNVLSGTEALTAKLFEQAMKGNIRAFETLRDTVGQKPVEKVMIADVDPNVINEVERMVFDEPPAST